MILVLFAILLPFCTAGVDFYSPNQQLAMMLYYRIIQVIFYFLKHLYPIVGRVEFCQFY